MCRDQERACWGVLLSCHTIRLAPRIVATTPRPSHVRPLSPPLRLTSLKVQAHPRKADERGRVLGGGGARQAGVVVEARVPAASSWCMMSDPVCARHRRRAAAASSERQGAAANAARQSPGREPGAGRCRRGRRPAPTGIESGLTAHSLLSAQASRGSERSVPQAPTKPKGVSISICSGPEGWWFARDLRAGGSRPDSSWESCAWAYSRRHVHCRTQGRTAGQKTTGSHARTGYQTMGLD